MNHSDPKSFGYYSVGQFEVFSKIEALELSARVNQPVQYHFNDQVFALQDWTAEPAADLSHLYRARALQLREQYDYVVLFYSGGADSHNMLEAFLHAGVEPDEIASFHCFGHEGNSVNKEIATTAIPYVQALKDSGRLRPTVEHRLIDMREQTTDFARTLDWGNYQYHVNTYFATYTIARTDLRQRIKKWADLIAAGKRVALVWGYEKPKVTQTAKGFVNVFFDLQDSCISVLNQQFTQDGYFDEFFYSTPAMPEITVKQAHVVKNFLKSATVDHPYLSTQVQLSPVPTATINGQAVWLTQDGLSYLVYPWFNDTLYYEKKERDVVKNRKDNWFWSDPVLSEKFHAATNSIMNQFRSKLFNVSPNGRYSQLYRTREYWLGE